MQPSYYVGIRSEDKSVWERRVPLAPVHVKEIMDQNPDIGFIVQSSKKRIFSDAEYAAVGAKIVHKLEELAPCQTILGIKEVPVDKLIPEKTFIFFSHTIKVLKFPLRPKSTTCQLSTPSWPGK